MTDRPDVLREALDTMVTEVREGTRTLSDGYSVTPDGAMRQRKAIDRIQLAVAAFANVLALATPDPAPSFEGGLDVIAEAIYDAMRENDPEGAVTPWVPGGNSLKQDEARRRARRVLARLQESSSQETE